MSKISPIIGSTKQLTGETRFINDALRKHKLTRHNLKTLKQFQPLNDDIAEFSSNFQKNYNDYKNIEETNSLMSFERRKLAQIEDTVSQGYFRDEEIFDEMSDYASRSYSADDIPIAEKPSILSQISTVFSLDKDLDKSIQRKLKRISMGDKLEKEAVKFGRYLTFKETPIIAEEALVQKEAGISEKRIIQNFKRSFLNKRNPQDKNFSVELFRFLSQKPGNRKDVILKAIDGDEIVDTALIEFFPKINSILSNEKLTQEVMEDCRVDGITDPTQCNFAKQLCQIYGKWDDTTKDFLQRTVFDTIKGPKSCEEAVNISLKCLRENNYSITKTLMDRNYIYKMKHLDKDIRKKVAELSKN